MLQNKLVERGIGAPLAAPFNAVGAKVQPAKNTRPQYHVERQPRGNTRHLALTTSRAAEGAVAAQAETARNVVIAVDASEDSIAAFYWALNNIWRHGDSLHVLHVVPDLETPVTPAPGSVFYPRYDEPETQIMRQAEEFIQQEFVCLGKQRGVEVNVVIVREQKRSHLGQTLCRKAEELHANPLVLFAHHKSKVEEFLLGSVSKFVSSSCKRPVLLVHPEHSQLQ